MFNRHFPTALFSLVLLALAVPTRAELFTLSVSGTITQNTTSDPRLPVGTPWRFELTYNTAAPDLDFQFSGAVDPTFGHFTNGGAIPALMSFHYRAGSYEVTLDDPSDFGAFSNIDITFLGAVHAIDINITSSLFPELAGGAVSFHADFNDSSHTALTSDGLPRGSAIGVLSFPESSVTLLPPRGVIIGGGQDFTSLGIAAVPEPSLSTLLLIGLFALLTRPRSRPMAD